MRVIGGFLKGKKIDFLNSSTTRPLKDIVKESIFNVIQHSRLINTTIYESNILDLYSGIGSFGIECISRGAKKVTFIEKNSEALKVLNTNLEKLKIQNETLVLPIDINSSLTKLENSEKFQIIFLDPPFAENTIVKVLEGIKKSNIFSEKHLIVIHRESKSEDLLTNFFQILDKKKYGRSCIIFGIFLK